MWRRNRLDLDPILFLIFLSSGFILRSIANVFCILLLWSVQTYVSFQGQPTNQSDTFHTNIINHKVFHMIKQYQHKKGVVTSIQKHKGWYFYTIHPVLKRIKCPWLLASIYVKIETSRTLIVNQAMLFLEMTNCFKMYFCDESLDRNLVKDCVVSQSGQKRAG